MDFYNERQKLNELRASVKTSAEAVDPEKLNAELTELREKQNAENFWSDMEGAKHVNRRIAQIEKKLGVVTALEKEIDDVAELMDLTEEMGDESEAEEIRSILKRLEKETEELFLETLMTGKYDSNNAILTIHAGAGGTEAQDWADMLYRMYTRYAERAGYEQVVLDYQQGDEAGIKSVTFQLNGDNAYGFLKAEKGVHRLVRISPFDANKRRHTSFASLEVMPEIVDEGEIKINPEELRIDTCRSSGAGGQHVNKTESAIRITHLPTGIVVSSQVERSHFQNLENCREMLRAKLAEIKEREHLEKISDIKGVQMKIDFGSAIRSYVFMPYTLAKDARTGFENGNINAVMDGDIDGFINAYLAMKAGE